MKKIPLFILILTFLVFSLAGIAYSWQGRMAGMGDPYGLIMDESDFLIHPAGIANGKGLNFYGHYQATYKDVTHWDITVDRINSPNPANWPFRTSGDEWRHDALVGAALPMGPGRMGLFLQYSATRGDYDGKENEWNTGTNYFHKYNLENDLDAFSLRLLYGLPMGGIKLGSEIQLAYHREKNETFMREDFSGGAFGFHTNYPFGPYYGWLNLFPFMIPYDSKYWEALLKGSLEGAVGPLKIAFTLYGSFIFAGDNKSKYDYLDTFGSTGSLNVKGDTKGWSIGSDFWLRYPLSNNLSLPFLLKIQYQEKTRDGNGNGINVGGPLDGGTANFDYENKEKNLQVEVGGGVEKEFGKGTRIAAGIYYDFLQNKSSLWGLGILPATGDWGILNLSKYPDLTEHRVILRLSGEKEFNSSFALRMGMNFFYGWVKEDFKFSGSDSSPSSFDEKISLDGTRWGIGAFMGGTIKFVRLNIEPFIGGGYQRLNTDGDGTSTRLPPRSYEMEKKKEEWFVGGGVSIKY
jgi:hypothetical protein